MMNGLLSVLSRHHCRALWIAPHNQEETEMDATTVAVDLAKEHLRGGIPVKTVEQQTLLLALHRVRQHWQADWTARIKVMRGLLRERGLATGVGARAALTHIPALLEDATVVRTDPIRHLVWFLFEQVHAVRSEALKQASIPIKVQFVRTVVEQGRAGGRWDRRASPSRFAELPRAPGRPTR